MMKYIVIFLGLLGFVLSGCTLQPKPKETKERSALILWKSSQMKYADMGFIIDEGKKLKVEIYSSGSAVMRLSVDGIRVCMSTLECLSKREFNARVLSSHYPDDLVESIFRGAAIFSGEGLYRHSEGFNQKIVRPTHHIEYSVDSQVINFKDSINGIHIKVTKI